MTSNEIFKEQRSNRKYTIIGVCVVLVLSMTIAEYSRRKRKLQESIAARNFIYERIAGIAGSFAILEMTAREIDLGPGNQALAACLGHGGECQVTDPAQQMPFGLRSGIDPSQPLIVGTKDRPAYYNQQGAIGCTSMPDEPCSGWIAEAWFWAECPVSEPQFSRPKSCTKAEKIFIRHRVSGSGDLSSLGSLPPNHQFETTNSQPTMTVLVPHDKK